MRSDSYVVVVETLSRYPISPKTLQQVLTGSTHFNEKVRVEVLAGEEWDDLEDQSELLTSEEAF